MLLLLLLGKSCWILKERLKCEAMLEMPGMCCHSCQRGRGWVAGCDPRGAGQAPVPPPAPGCTSRAFGTASARRGCRGLRRAGGLAPSSSPLLPSSGDGCWGHHVAQLGLERHSFRKLTLALVPLLQSW